MSPQPFAHMRPAEAMLWVRWLARHGQEFVRFQYDVRVGRGRPGDPSAPPAIQRDWQMLTQQRIDVVGWSAGVPTLFEVSPRGGRAAFGALEIYADLYREHPEYPGTLHLAMVVGRIHPDLERVAREHGITVYVVPDAEEAV